MSEGAYESASETARERLSVIARAGSGDPNDLDRAVRENLPLVTHLAKRLLRPETDFEDLFQTGCVGLIKAIRRFDPRFGVAFSTYAVPVILGEMRRSLRDGGQIHIARSIRERAAAIARCEEEYRTETGRAPTFGELAERLGLTREEIALAYGARRPAASLDAPAPGMEEGVLGDLIGDQGMRGVEESIVFQQLLAALPSEDRELIELRYRQGKTQTETGGIMGLTQVQVCRREKRILMELRKASGAEGDGL